MRAVLFGAAMAALLGASVLPYQRTQTSGGHCLHWAAGPVTFAQSLAGDPALGAAGFEAVTRSWQTWETQMQACGNLTLSEAARVASRTIGYVPDGGENLILFRRVRCIDVVDAGDPCMGSGSCGNAHDCWDYPLGVLGLTTTSYRTMDGVLLDADIELNAADGFFTTVDAPPCDAGTRSPTCVVNDTQNATTHEFGHALGLAHSPDRDSTMFASAPPGETSKRTLDPGSLQFVCDVYPAGQPSQDCVSSDAGPDAGPGPGGGTTSTSSGGCATAGAGAVPAAVLGLLLASCALALQRRRR